MNTLQPPADPPLRYPLSLGLLDYAPVVLTLVGQGLLVAALPDAFAGLGAVAAAGAAMMFAGGFCKASWKTLIAATAKDVRWMEHALFPLLAPGAALFAWAAWQARGQQAGEGIDPATLWIPLLASAVLLAASVPRMARSRKWFLPLVALLTVSMGVIAASAALLARGAGDLVAAVLFVASFGVSLVTAAQARRTTTIAAQWRMEFANTGAALLFAGGALHLAALTGAS